MATVAYAGNGGLLPGEAHSPNAHRIDDAFIFVAIFTGIILVLVEGALIAFIVKYRRGKRPRTAEGPQIHGSTKLEILWTVLPVVILAAIGSFVFYKLPGISDVPASSKGDRLNVRVDCEWELCRGRTVVDVWRRTGLEPNANVAVGIDSQAFLDLLLERLAKLG